MSKFNIIKKVFEKMGENILVDLDDDSIHDLAASYLFCGMNAMNIKMITVKMEESILANDIEDYYDLSEIYLIEEEDFEKYAKLDRVFRVYKEMCEGVEVVMLKLDDSFARSYVEVVKEI